MTRQILIDGTVLEVRVARLLGRRLIDIDFVPLIGPRTDQLEVSDRAVGRLAARLPGGQGAIVDLGSEQVFVRAPPKALSEGQSVGVRIAASAYGTKLARGVIDQATAEHVTENASERPSPNPEDARLVGAGSP